MEFKTRQNINLKTLLNIFYSLPWKQTTRKKISISKMFKKLTLFQKNPFDRLNRHFVRRRPSEIFPGSQTAKQVDPSHVFDETPSGKVNSGHRFQSAEDLNPTGNPQPPVRRRAASNASAYVGCSHSDASFVLIPLSRRLFDSFYTLI